jgi:glycosyltransferase involved in cell wall biosynthesis
VRLLVYLPNFAPFGGIENHLVNALALFARTEYASVLLTIRNKMCEADRKMLQKLGVEFVEANQPREEAGRLTRLAWLSRQIVRLKAAPAFDIIYTNATGMTPALVWLIGARKTRIVHHHHNSGGQDERRIWSKGYSLVIKYAPELIACSNTTAANLIGMRGKRQIKVLPYLTAEMILQPTESPACMRKKNPIVFGFFGRVTRGKGIDWITKLSSLPEFQAVEFSIHGGGTEYTLESFAPYRNIHYYGPYTTPLEQSERLGSVDCVILPSIHVEGLPLCLLEAMGAGKPWVATDKGGVRELAVSKKDCIVTPPTFEGFRAGLLQMLNNLQKGLTNEASLYDLYRLNFSLHVRQEAWLSYFGIEHHSLCVI